MSPDRQDSEIVARLVIVLSMIVISSVVVMSVPVMVVVVPVTVSSAVALPETAGTCDKQDAGQNYADKSSHVAPFVRFNMTFLFSRF